MKYEVKVVRSCPTLCNRMDCSLPGSSVHGILQARVLEGDVIPFSSESFWPRDWTRVCCVTSRFFTVWATREAHRHTHTHRENQTMWLNSRLWKEHLKGYILYDFNYVTFWKSQNYGDSIKISGFHGLRGRKDELVENREILGQWKLFCMIL